MRSEKYSLKQAKTAKRIIKYFAKFQASIFLMSRGKIWNNGQEVSRLWLLKRRVLGLIKKEIYL